MLETDPRVAVASTDLIAVSTAQGQSLFERNNVEARDGHAGIIVKPHNHTARTRIQSSVVSRGNGIPPAARGDNGEGLEGGSLQVLSDVAGHGANFTPHRSPRQSPIPDERLPSKCATARSRSPLQFQDLLPDGLRLRTHRLEPFQPPNRPVYLALPFRNQRQPRQNAHRQ